MTRNFATLEPSELELPLINYYKRNVNFSPLVNTGQVSDWILLNLLAQSYVLNKQSHFVLPSSFNFFLQFWQLKGTMCPPFYYCFRLRLITSGYPLVIVLSFFFATHVSIIISSITFSHFAASLLLLILDPHDITHSLLR